MLILLTHANHLYADRKQVRKMQPYPPLQTLIAASYLRAHGFEVALFDATFHRDIQPALDRYQPDLVAVCEDNFNFLTKMCLLQNRELAFEIAAACAKRGIPAVVNSSDATDQAQAYLAAGFGYVILGELESTLLEICNCGAGPCPAGQPVAGSAWLGNGEAVTFGPPRAPIESLDQLSPPAWDLVEIDLYRNAWMDTHGYFCLNLVTSRGCPYRCNWCAKPVYGHTYRHYSPERVAAELACVKDLFHPDLIWFADDIFGLPAKWTREFAAAVERLGASIPYRIQSRCNLMTRDTVLDLEQSGCVEVWMGVESGSQRILDAMDKGTRVEEVRLARENLRRHGIRAGFFLQFGYLGEEWEDIESTIRLVRETKPDDVGISVSYPLPNTRFHQIVKDQLGSKLGSKSHWSDSGDLDLMFPGTFSSEFYRALADALHLEVRGPLMDPSASDKQSRDAWEKVEQLRCACC